MNDIKNTMLYIAGSKTAFRCHCGCNVFHPVENEGVKTFECNGCGDWYTDHDSRTNREPIEEDKDE